MCQSLSLATSATWRCKCPALALDTLALTAVALEGGSVSEAQVARALAEQAGRGRLSAEFPGQFAGAFPFVDVPQDLPFGEGAHRLS
jgi:hypothetical protein